MGADVLQLRIGWTDDAVVLGLAGELDLAAADELEVAMRRLAATPARHIVVDLADLEFVDSSGLRALLRARETVVASGRTLAMTNPAPAVERVFDITGTGALLQLA